MVLPERPFGVQGAPKSLKSHGMQPSMLGDYCYHSSHVKFSIAAAPRRHFLIVFFAFLMFRILTASTTL
jgi:hypothetical protein